MHDLGGGKGNVQTERLKREHGLKNATGSDQGSNVGPKHNQEIAQQENAVHGVTIANVHNLLTHDQRDAMLKQAHRMTKKGGFLIANHPTSPRKHGQGNSDLEKHYGKFYHNVHRVSLNSGKPTKAKSEDNDAVWICHNPRGK